MTKKIICIAVAVIMALSLVSCGEPEEKKGESERDKYMALRKEFIGSTVYAEAKAYVEDCFNVLLPGCKMEMSLEPGTLTKEEIENAFADFSSNESTRLSLFKKARLSFSVNYDELEVTAEALANDLIARQISGDLYSPNTSSSLYYKLDAEKGTFEKVIVPET